MFPPADTTKEHFSFTIALGMRTFVVITKIDMCQEQTTDRVIEQVKLLSSYKKIATVVKDDGEVLTAAQNFLNGKCVCTFKLVHLKVNAYFLLFVELFQSFWCPV